MAEQERIREAQRQSRDALLRKRNVVGSGVGYKERGGQRTDELCVVVLVREKVPGRQLRAEDLIPQSINGVPVDVQEVGDIGPL